MIIFSFWFDAKGLILFPKLCFGLHNPECNISMIIKWYQVCFEVTIFCQENYLQFQNLQNKVWIAFRQITHRDHTLLNVSFSRTLSVANSSHFLVNSFFLKLAHPPCSAEDQQEEDKYRPQTWFLKNFWDNPSFVC